MTQDDNAIGESSGKAKIQEKAANHREGHKEPNQAETMSQGQSNPETQKELRVLSAVSLQHFNTANA